MARFQVLITKRPVDGSVQSSSLTVFEANNYVEAAKRVERMMRIAQKEAIGSPVITADMSSKDHPATWRAGRSFDQWRAEKLRSEYAR